MKKFGFLVLPALLLFFSSCASDEEVRVQNVIGAYDCAVTCVEIDLTGQTADSTSSHQEVVFVKEAEAWKEGMIYVGETEVFLESDSTFSFSSSTYFISGEFTTDGRIVFTETTIDTENNVRLDCEFQGFQK